MSPRRRKVERPRSRGDGNRPGNGSRPCLDTAFEGASPLRRERELERHAHTEPFALWELDRRLQRLGRELPEDLRRRMLRPPRSLATDLPARVWAIDDEGRERTIGRGPTPPGERFEIPAHRLWGLSLERVDNERLAALPRLEELWLTMPLTLRQAKILRAAPRLGYLRATTREEDRTRAAEALPGCLVDP